MSDQFTACAASACTRNANRRENGKRGFCSMHYQRVKKFGDPEIVKRVPSPAIDWIREHREYTGEECLRWPFHIGIDGYGRVHTPITGNLTTASRMMCLEVHGQPPSLRHEAAHRCGKGNQGCVNPKHLYWATPSENQNDRVTHGTSNRGSQQGRARLTENDVFEIRVLLESSSGKAIAQKFGVHPSVISHIKAGRSWRWLTD